MVGKGRVAEQVVAPGVGDAGCGRVDLTAKQRLMQNRRIMYVAQFKISGEKESDGSDHSCACPCASACVCPCVCVCPCSV